MNKGIPLSVCVDALTFNPNLVPRAIDLTLASSSILRVLNPTGSREDRD